MGGANSSRWQARAVRTSVEGCFTIAARHARRGVHWTDSAPGVLTWERVGFRVLYRVRIEDEWGELRLSYHSPSAGRQVLQTVYLTTTRPHYGGLRWWFCCPRCRRRVARLHLPSRVQRFGCRTCHDLSYESAQTSRGSSRSFFLLVARETGLNYSAARAWWRARNGGYEEEPRVMYF